MRLGPWLLDGGREQIGLPDGSWDAYREHVRGTDASEADAIASGLANLGDVTVVAPEKEFKTMRTIPQASK